MQKRTNTHPQVLPHTAPVQLVQADDGLDAEWTQLLTDTPRSIMDTVGDIVAEHREAMATEFYAVMMSDPEACRFLSNETVHKRLHASIQRWMDTLFGGQHDQPHIMAALQRQVGDVHARAEIPVQLVSRGMRLLKLRLFDLLVPSALVREELVFAVEYVSTIMDLAFAEMSAAYLRSHEQGARTDELFRMATAGQNVALERERQLLALTEWENSLLRALTIGSGFSHISGLRSSAFGLWMQHKAPLLFEDTAELQGIAEQVRRLDSTFLPLLMVKAPDPSRSPEFGLSLRDFMAELGEVRFLVNSMFDRLTDLEAGRDVLTQLYNRRFLPTIMRRAMKLAMRQENSFALLMIDVDHFKRVNDVHGHDAGDRVLQQVASLLLTHGRASDFYFRYGGEEFLAVLNEVDAEQALAVAEKIRARMHASNIGLGDGQNLRVSVSIGVAVHDGHPDFHHLIGRADNALYQAKQTGRNRVCVAS